MKHFYCMIIVQLMLSACQKLHEQDIADWINKNQNIAATAIASPVEQDNLQKFIYQAKDRLDPFDSKKFQYYLQQIPQQGIFFLRICIEQERCLNNMQLIV